MIPFIIIIASACTLLLNIFIVIMGIGWIFKKFKFQPIANWYFLVYKLIEKNAIFLLFGVTLSGILGSLFFSEIAHFALCQLCWYQRLLLYPQIIILAAAVWLKKPKIIPIGIIPLSIIGGAIAIYNYIIQIPSKPIYTDHLIPCSLNGTSCSIRYFVHFGYITIPMMALSAFLITVIISIIIKKSFTSQT